MRELANVMVEMRDGVRLATDLYLPDEEGVYPAIAVRTPYIKERWKAQHLDGDQYMNSKNIQMLVTLWQCRIAEGPVFPKEAMFHGGMMPMMVTITLNGWLPRVGVPVRLVLWDLQILALFNCLKLL